MNTADRARPFVTRNSARQSDQTSLIGISEWEHMRLYEPTDQRSADETYALCIERHRALGFDAIVWSCARSVVYYQSQLTENHPCANATESTQNYLWQSIQAACPLRSAIRHCRAHGLPLLGRVTMNRHYSATSLPEHHSRFAANHPHLQELERDGQRCPSRLCYVFDQVQHERIQILLELQQIGVDGLVLDFCRQPPMLMYHDALVEPFMRRHGYDPRRIDTRCPDDFQPWFQHRADVMTGFLRRLRDEVRNLEASLGRPCPIVARIGDAAGWINLACGIDAARWLSEDLVDALMLSPYPLTVEDDGRHAEDYIQLAHAHGKACFGGVGSHGLMHGHDRASNASLADAFDADPVFALAAAQLAAGADGMSVYQSETLALLPHLAAVLPHLSNRAYLALWTGRPVMADADEKFVGADWHAAWLRDGRRYGQLLGLGTPPTPGLWRPL